MLRGGDWNEEASFGPRQYVVDVPAGDQSIFEPQYFPLNAKDPDTLELVTAWLHRWTRLADRLKANRLSGGDAHDRAEIEREIASLHLTCAHLHQGVALQSRALAYLRDHLLIHDPLPHVPHVALLDPRASHASGLHISTLSAAAPLPHNIVQQSVALAPPRQEFTTDPPGWSTALPSTVEERGGVNRAPMGRRPLKQWP
jgi:hypothetical protein